MAKSNTAETERRRNTIYQMLMECYTTRQIMRYAADTWGLKSRQVQEYIRKCHEEIQETSETNREKLLKDAIKRTNHLYSKCLFEHDKKTAATVLKHLNELKGLMRTNIEISGNLEVTNLTADQRKAKISELIARRGN